MKTTTPYKPWEIMSYAKDLLGIGYMQRLLGIKSHTQVFRYCRNPEMITEDPPATGFIERTRQLGVNLQQAGESKILVRILPQARQGQGKAGGMKHPCPQCGNRHRDKLTPPCSTCLEFVRYQVLAFPDDNRRAKKK